MPYMCSPAVYTILASVFLTICGCTTPSINEQVTQNREEIASRKRGYSVEEGEIREMVARAPRNAEYRFRLAVILAAQGKEGEAKEQFRNYIKLGGHDPARRRALVAIIKERRDADAAHGKVSSLHSEIEEERQQVRNEERQQAIDEEKRKKGIEVLEEEESELLSKSRLSGIYLSAMYFGVLPRDDSDGETVNYQGVFRPDLSFDLYYYTQRQSYALIRRVGISLIRLKAKPNAPLFQVDPSSEVDPNPFSSSTASIHVDVSPTDVSLVSVYFGVGFPFPGFRVYFDVGFGIPISAKLKTPVTSGSVVLENIPTSAVFYGAATVAGNIDLSPRFSLLIEARLKYVGGIYSTTFFQYEKGTLMLSAVAGIGIRFF